MSSVGYHEPVGELPGETRDMPRAIVSLMPPWCRAATDPCSEADGSLRHG